MGGSPVKIDVAVILFGSGFVVLFVQKAGPECTHNLATV